jgi:hypothetical protein
MSKKTNTLLFILGATVFNILVTVISFIVLFVIYAKTLLPALPQDSAGIAFPVIFIGAIALSFVIYRVILKQITRRINMEEHFDPIFNFRRNVKRRD